MPTTTFKSADQQEQVSIMGETGVDDPSLVDQELRDMDEDRLWEMVEGHRYRIVRGVSPSRLTPYLRQAKVLGQLDEEEILHSPQFTNRAMRVGHMLDLLKSRGKNGALAFLESLKLHNPDIYVLITGLEPSIDHNNFSDLIESSQLTECLAKAVSSLQEELSQEKRQKVSLLQHCRRLKENTAQLEAEAESLRGIETECNRMKRELSAHFHEALKLKDELYGLSLRYSSALQEKDLAITRSRSLQEELYLMKQELQRAQVSSCHQRERSSRISGDTQMQTDELLKLTEENEHLKSLLELETFSVVQKDILEQNLDDALEGKQELLNRLHSLREQAALAENQRKQCWEEKENTLIECQKMKVDCEIYKEQISALQAQISDLQKERDQAYNARDTAQLEISQSLLEKDSLRRKVFELTNEICEVRKKASMGDSVLTVPRSGHLITESKDHCPKKKQPLVRMHAICPREDSQDSLMSISEVCISILHPSHTFASSLSSRSWSWSSHDQMDSFRSCSPIPPCKLSLQRRAMQDSSLSWSSQEFLDEEFSVTSAEEKGRDPSFEYDMGRDDGSSLWLHVDPCISESVPMRRRLAQRFPSRITTIAFQANALLEQISIIGGNQTGIFIHRVTPGSIADEMSLSPGQQIVLVDYGVMEPGFKAVLEDATLEEALWVLEKVNGFCCLSVKHNMEGYKKLLTDLNSKLVTSGDSFYIRSNLCLEKQDPGELSVECHDILHVTDTVYQGQTKWSACQVNPYTIKDMDAGTIPNYFQAQQQLIALIQELAQKNMVSRKNSSFQRKLVRIVSTSNRINPLWSTMECSFSDSNKPKVSPRNCVSLMPYTFVRHYRPGQPRPVLVVPALLRKILADKLCLSREFEKCPSDTQNTESSHENKELNGSSCIPRQDLEQLMQKDVHAWMDLGLESVQELLAMDIYPIIILITIGEKNSKKIKKALQRLGATEDQLLESARKDEAQLETVSCLYRTIAPDAWGDLDALNSCVRVAVADEQKKVVWVEQVPHRPF
ncbi:caspase recruitment domain-containing protein 14 isoform X2 [Ahaetulla prasina]|uniref:caspase recruitment domain-containing protein 14 isoform X2 n=1 Tax=Ahaetulla prasina TaxID=499056 RepID=UPI0026475596|nr:caspase recruitment domain-containing protein 14 isoform X2 [Ahaetulla prasina]